MTDRNDEPPAARPRRRKRLKLRMPWDDWFDLPPEERAEKESAFLDYLEDTYGEEDIFPGVIAMFEAGYKDAIRAWHEKKRRRRSRGSGRGNRM